MANVVPFENYKYGLQYKVIEIMSERLKTLKAKEDTINFKDIKVYRIRDIFQELKKPEAYEALQLIIKDFEEMKIITKKKLYLENQGRDR